METVAALTELIKEVVLIPPEGVEWLLKQTELRPVRSIAKIKQRAAEYQITPAAALYMRQRYLLDELKLWGVYSEAAISLIGPHPYRNIPSIKKELNDIAAALETLKEPIRTDEVTPQMVEQAREVRVDTLIEFKRGKAHCPFHDDKVASLFYGTRTNRAVCPSGCNDSWDSIALTQKLMGLSFHDAVRQLCR